MLYSMNSSIIPKPFFCCNIMMKEITEIQKNLYCVELPLPNNPLKSINSYVLKGKKRSLIIDTGMNRPECKSVLLPALRDLGIDLAVTDLFVTHLHADHFGLTGDLATDSSKCYMGRGDRAIVTGKKHWDDFLHFFTLNGFPESILKESLSRHPGVLYSPSRLVEITPVDDGQIIEIDGCQLTCVETPGHSPGHMCLYDAARKIFFSGDHILFDITPNIAYWPEMKDALRSYLSSLDKVSTLDVSNVLPGHRKPWHDHLARIEELKTHHRHRLDEAIAALEEGDMTAYEVAPYITWKIEFREWDDFPIAQKFFAVGETIAHLHYLENEGTVRSYTEDGTVYFALA
jgi:glyoxylase-like metal-dependent hydrolase (beta-lactamase superfamily II)